jgi:hypothetical protein
MCRPSGDNFMLGVPFGHPFITQGGIVNCGIEKLIQQFHQFLLAK